MNRRDFSFATAGLCIASAAALDLNALPAVALTRDSLQKASGQRVRLVGWLHPARFTPGHYVTLGSTAAHDDPRSADPAAWTDGLVRIYPARPIARSGRVELVGRLWYGHSRDMATGHAARAVLTEARLA